MKLHNLLIVMIYMQACAMEQSYYADEQQEPPIKDVLRMMENEELRARMNEQSSQPTEQNSVENNEFISVITSYLRQQQERIRQERENGSKERKIEESYSPGRSEIINPQSGHTTGVANQLSGQAATLLAQLKQQVIQTTGSPSLPIPVNPSNENQEKNEKVLNFSLLLPNNFSLSDVILAKVELFLKRTDSQTDAITCSYNLIGEKYHGR